MHVLVVMILGEMQPDAKPHQKARGDKLHSDRFTKQKQSGNSSDKRRSREVSAGPRRS